MKALNARVAAVRGQLSDPLARNSTLILATTILMAAAGSVFWVIAARLQPRSHVGLAGSFVSATVTLSYLAQLGMNITLIRTLPHSERRSADVTGSVTLVSGFALVIAAVYGALLPTFSPSLSGVLDQVWKVAVFAILVAATAVNLLTDGIFLGLQKVGTNLRVNGLLMGVAKCALCFGLAGFGAFGLFGAVGAASLVAAVASVVAIRRATPGPLSLRPSRSLWEARRFAGAGYVTSVMDLLPQLVLPVIIINGSGASSSALYFVSFQIVTLLNSVCYAIGSSMYAEGARRPESIHEIVRRAGHLMAGAVALGVLGLVAVSPLLLAVFGHEYADQGVPTLRVLAVGVVGVAFNYWSAIRLRLAHRLRAMMTVQLSTTVAMIGLAMAFADHGPAWVAGAWGIGQLFGGCMGYLASRTVAPLRGGPDSGPDADTRELAPADAIGSAPREGA